MSRRWFLKFLGALGLSSFFRTIPSYASSEPLFYRNMDALTEAIMPGADLGVQRNVRETLMRARDTAKLCMLGLDAMEEYSAKKFGGSFHVLNESEKIDVLYWMEEMPREKLMRVFFERYRQTVISYYYTKPAVWRDLKYNGPPQPKGYMDYHLPPEKDR